MKTVFNLNLNSRSACFTFSPNYNSCTITQFPHKAFTICRRDHITSNFPQNFLARSKGVMFLCEIRIELKIRGKVFSNGFYEALIELRDFPSKLSELQQWSK